MAGRLILVIFACIANGITNSQNLESPCPELFEYDTTNENEQDRWYGNLTLLSNKNLDGVWIRLLFSNAPLRVEFQNEFGEINTFDSVNYILKDVDYELEANTPLMLRFYVQYNPSKPVPLLIGIRLNAETICAAEKSENLPDPVSNKANNKTTTTVSNVCSLQADSCGRPSLTKPGSLVLEGDSIEGTWPWIVAIHMNSRGIIKHRCGGSLISHNFIVTTAVCLVIDSTGDPYTPNKVLAYLGTTSTTDYSDGLQVATISRIVIHPEYATKNYDNNIAILKTERSIEYTYFVRPICLWDGDDDINNLVEKKGNVIAWEDDRYGTSSKIVKQYELVIIDNTSCGSANPENFKRLLHERGFCAGVKNGSSGFSGETGSSLAVKRSNVNSEEVWYLRGLTSSCQFQKDSKNCDPNYYTFFIDVAKYVPWIKERMKDI